MTVPVVGTLLMFSLMIGPVAAARSATARPGLALALSVRTSAQSGVAVAVASRQGLGRLALASPLTLRKIFSFRKGRAGWSLLHAGIKGASSAGVTAGTFRRVLARMA
jgi:hypothetical protein